MRFDDAFRTQLRDLLVWRRDVRRFRSEPLPAGALERLIEMACLAPSVGLSQPWRFVIVDDPRATSHKDAFVRMTSICDAPSGDKTALLHKICARRSAHLRREQRPPGDALSFPKIISTHSDHAARQHGRSGMLLEVTNGTRSNQTNQRPSRNQPVGPRAGRGSVRRRCNRCIGSWAHCRWSASD